ncbi:hypothetical protein PMIN04_005243 [Paraphaeosphaeria minitans]
MVLLFESNTEYSTHTILGTDEDCSLLGSSNLPRYLGNNVPSLKIGNARPQLVRCIVALEPRGPPCEKKYAFQGQKIAFGIAEGDGELEYDPPAGPNASPSKTDMVPAKSAHRHECTLQADPPKNLKNLGIQCTSPGRHFRSKFHAPFNYNTVLNLEQAGFNVEHTHPPAEGIRGNEHMLFMELNKIAIAKRVRSWLKRHYLNLSYLTWYFGATATNTGT